MDGDGAVRAWRGAHMSGVRSRLAFSPSTSSPCIRGLDLGSQQATREKSNGERHAGRIASHRRPQLLRARWHCRCRPEHGHMRLRGRMDLWHETLSPMLPSLPSAAAAATSIRTGASRGEAGAPSHDLVSARLACPFGRARRRRKSGNGWIHTGSEQPAARRSPSAASCRPQQWSRAMHAPCRAQ